MIPLLVLLDHVHVHRGGAVPGGLLASDDGGWVEVYYILYTYKLCKGGVCGVMGGKRASDKIPAAKSLYRSIFLDNDIWH
jgi:hypothetical protein